jgi:hypothetical protein
MKNKVVRTETVLIRLTERERLILEQAAKADHTTLSDYVRVGALTSACLDGNREALKLLAGKVKESIAEQARALLPDREQVTA